MPSKNTSEIKIYVTPEMKADIKRYAKLNGMNVSEVVRSALEDSIGIEDNVPAHGAHLNESTRRASDAMTDNEDNGSN